MKKGIDLESEITEFINNLSVYTTINLISLMMIHEKEYESDTSDSKELKRMIYEECRKELARRLDMGAVRYEPSVL